MLCIAMTSQQEVTARWGFLEGEKWGGGVNPHPSPSSVPLSAAPKAAVTPEQLVVSHSGPYSFSIPPICILTSPCPCQTTSRHRASSEVSQGVSRGLPPAGNPTGFHSLSLPCITVSIASLAGQGPGLSSLQSSKNVSDFDGGRKSLLTFAVSRLRWGESSKAWLQRCPPALRSCPSTVDVHLLPGKRRGRQRCATLVRQSPGSLSFCALLLPPPASAATSKATQITTRRQKGNFEGRAS